MTATTPGSDGTGAARVTVRRSTFYGYVAPAADPEALSAFLLRVRAEHKAARHVAYAWIGAKGEVRASDAGEPHGTAGRPCLAALQRAGVHGTAVAVARHFGGTLLGTGNLARAYAAAAQAAIDDATGAAERQARTPAGGGTHGVGRLDP